MADLAVWPDVHDLLPVVLADLCDHIVGPRTPPNFQDLLPLVRVQRIGGNNDQHTDYNRVTVDVWARTYPSARDLAEAVRQRLLNFPHFTDIGCIDRAETEVAPIELAYADPTIRLFTAIYRLSARR